MGFVGVRMMALVMMIIVAISVGGVMAGTQVHHVVGGDRGWDPSNSDIASWASGRVFRVGDKIWFSYSAAHESIAELKSEEEYESCDVKNPIKMYTDGIDAIPLEMEGIRYFASSKPDSCKNGLKLHVDVMPEHFPVIPKISRSADAPTIPTPSTCTRISASFVFGFVGLWVCFMGF